MGALSPASYGIHQETRVLHQDGVPMLSPVPPRGAAHPSAGVAVQLDCDCEPFLTASGRWALLSAASYEDACEVFLQPPVHPQLCNLNDYVWVRLTDAGRKVLRANFAGTLLHQRYADAWLNPNQGWVRFQHWELMQIFGSVAHNGAEPTFVDNQIALTDPEES